MSIDPMTLWQEQQMEVASYDPADLQARSRRLARQIRQRNLLEYVGAAVASLFFLLGALGLIGAQAPGLAGILMRIASAVLVGGLAVVAWQIHRRASAGASAPAIVNGLGFYVAELRRQRDALHAAGLWYIGPLVPGMVLFYIAAFLGTGEPLWTAAAAGGTALLFLGIVWLNRGAARRLGREIEQLRSGATEDASP